MTTVCFPTIVLDLAREAKAAGRRVYLATASNRRHADAIASYLGFFDGVFASDDTVNLSGETKALELVKAFGAGQFDYVGNNQADLAVWAHARRCYVVGDSPALMRKAKNRNIVLDCVETPGTSLRLWFRALRVHQYSKNVLVFVPLLTAHAYGLPFFIRAILAFVAFSLCASSVYLFNDLIDLNADRQHPTKRNRPFASGAIPLSHGVVAAPILLALAFGCGFAASIPFLITLLVYFLLTLAYALTLKRRLIVDIVVLATLYTSGYRRRCRPSRRSVGVAACLFDVHLCLPCAGEALYRTRSSYGPGASRPIQPQLPIGRPSYRRRFGGGERIQCRDDLRALRFLRCLEGPLSTPGAAVADLSDPVLLAEPAGDPGAPSGD